MTFAKLNAYAGIPLRYANRHGLITGATGTGKSVSLMRLVEQFSKAGVPSLVADVKGDISALSRSCSSRFIDLHGATKITFAAMGADLAARALELTDTQSAALEIAFAYGQGKGLPLDSIDDLRDCLTHMGNHREQVSQRFGQVSPASIGVIMRALLRLERQGGDMFAAPCFDVATLLDKPGNVTLLRADRLVQSPRLYGAFLLFILSDLYARLPEVGDLDKPRLVLFFDESHLLFDDCPSALLRKIEQTVRLIRSKGVGVYFASQKADDVPVTVREQLAHRLEHDRALPVGTCRFDTMSPGGMPAPRALVPVALPDCPLGPVDYVAPKPVAVRKPRRKRQWVPGALVGAWIVASVALGVQFAHGDMAVWLMLAWGGLTGIIAKLEGG